MTPERLAELASEYNLKAYKNDPIAADINELIDALREAEAKNEKWGRDYMKLAHENGGEILALQSAVALMRSLSINPTIPHGMRSLMKAELDRLDTHA